MSYLDRAIAAADHAEWQAAAAYALLHQCQKGESADELHAVEYGESVPVDDLVWCQTHGTIHGNTGDPYACQGDVCDPADHRPLFWTTKEGDTEHAP